jgi:hypothetical protein
MTIRAGGPWGATGPAPSDVVRPGGDAEAGSLVTSCREAGRDVPLLVPSAGDLFRAVGGASGVDRLAGGGDVAHLPCDVLRVTIDNERTVWAVAHVVVRRPLLSSSTLGWWRGRIVAVMNVQYLGDWDVAPRAHPNDGRADIVDVAASMRVRERSAARGRLPLGTHIPHPAISTRQARSWTLELAPGERVWIDGVESGGGTHLEITVEADAITVVV